MISNSIKIKVSTSSDGKPFLKQAPGLNPVWDNCTFFINEEVDQCDLWVTYGGLGKVESTICPQNGTLFISNEPPSVKRYSKKFTNQFSSVMSCKDGILHRNIIHSQQALPWWIGHKVTKEESSYEKTYDELKSIKTPQKEKLISVIASNKVFTKGHKQRYEFVQRLQKEFPNMVDVFGIGFNTVEDKWDAIALYKYHIVIENSSYDDYWTEKLSDCFLAESYPIYHGCPNILTYFSPSMMSKIDIAKPTEAIEIIRGLISSNMYENSVSSLKEAKRLILDTYQFFPMIASYAEKLLPAPLQKITLVPETESGIVNLFKRIFRKIIG